MSTTYCSEITIKFNHRPLWIKKISEDGKIIPLNDDGTYTYKVGDIMDGGQIIHEIQYREHSDIIKVDLVSYRENWKKCQNYCQYIGFWNSKKTTNNNWKLLSFKQGVRFEDTPESETW